MLTLQFAENRPQRQPIVLGDFNTPLITWTDHPERKSIRKTQVLDDTLDQFDLIDIYRAPHPKGTNFTFLSLFSSTNGTLS